MERLFDVVMHDSMHRIYFQQPGKERAAAIPNLPASATDGGGKTLEKRRLFLAKSSSGAAKRRGSIALTCVVQVHANGRNDPPVTDGVLGEILRSPRITRWSRFTFGNRRREVEVFARQVDHNENFGGRCNDQSAWSWPTAHHQAVYAVHYGSTNSSRHDYNMFVSQVAVGLTH